MGCDIHIYAEIKHKGKYKSLDVKGKGYYDNKQKVIEIYDNRNYQLFSILAGVRNYNNIIPISEPKGLPEDCCSQIKQEYKIWEGDAHSESYFTLKELEDYTESDELKPIINKLKERVKELRYEYTDENIRKVADDIRIVFWFDN